MKVIYKCVGKIFDLIDPRLHGYNNRIYHSLVGQPPAFIIIGAQKAGTTALYEFISKHPQIKASRDKELDFFSCDNLYSKGLTYYHSRFPLNVLSNRFITFDASPSYLFYSDTAKRIYEYNPGIKLVVILREPCERAFSAWNMHRKFFSKNKDWYTQWMMRCDIEYRRQPVIRRTQESLDNFTVYVKDELEAIANNDAIESPVLSWGLYHQQLIKYLEYFKHDQLLIITSDRLRRDPILELYNLENFLDIEHNNWTNVDLSPVFCGKYKIQPEREAAELLQNYYLVPNAELEKDFGIKFC